MIDSGVEFAQEDARPAGKLGTAEKGSRAKCQWACLALVLPPSLMSLGDTASTLLGNLSGLHDSFIPQYPRVPGEGEQ